MTDSWLARENPVDRLIRPLRSVGFKFLSRLSDPVVMAGSSSEQVVALTFDDGPNPPYTQQILGILDECSVKATFFLLGRQVLEYPAIARDVAAAGHAIGAHTYSHPLRVRQSPIHFRQEILRTHRLIADVTGRAPQTFRPPRGGYDPLLFAALKVLMGYRVIMWSVAAKDWREDGAEAVVSRVLKGVEPGAIVCLHDGCGDVGERASPDRTQTVLALPAIIDHLRSLGYRFVTIPELIGLGQTRGLCG